MDVPVLHDVDAGGPGETNRLVAWSEVVTKSCNTDTASALETRTKSCSAILDVIQEHAGKNVVEVVHKSPRERVQRRIVEHIVDFPVPQAVEGISDVAQFLLLRKSITKGIVKQNVAVPTPQDFQEHAQVVGLTAQECIQRQTDEHIVDVPVPMILVDLVEMVR